MADRFVETTVLVNFMPASWSVDDMKGLLSSVSGLSRCNIVRNYHTGASKTYGFGYYRSVEEAVSACVRFTGNVIMGKTLKVSLARPRGRAFQRTKVFVTDLPTWCTDLDLHEYFEYFGPVSAARVLRNVSTGNGRGRGFVLFTLHEHAEAAFLYFSHGHTAIKVSRGWNASRQDKAMRRSVCQMSDGIDSTVIVRGVSLFGSDEAVLDFFHQFGDIVEHHFVWMDLTQADAPPAVVTLRYSAGYNAELAISVGNRCGLDIAYV